MRAHAGQKQLRKHRQGSAGAISDAAVSLNAKACFDRFFLFVSPSPNKPQSPLANPFWPV
jgi:hypothetical protein